MIKAILVDDEIASIEIIKAHIGLLSGELELCAACRNIADAVNAIRLQKPDILLLDIDLGEGLSFEILEQLPDLQFHVIFITAYDHYAIKAIKYHAFDYILKPIVAEELHYALRKAMADIKNRKSTPDTFALLEYLKGNIAEKIAVPDRNGFSYYKLSDIVYVEANGSYVSLSLQNGNSVIVSKPLKNFEVSLINKGFLRVHKSYLVNIQHIVSVHRDDGGYLQMSNQKQVPISPKDKESIIDRIKQASNII